MTSEWDPILTPDRQVYADLRINGDLLELRLARTPNYTIVMDAKVIPHLIKILQRMDVRV
jgi:hypothetical protein